MRVRCLMLLAFFLTTVSVSGLAQPQNAAGTVTVTSFTPTDVRQADGNTIVEGVAIGSFTGTFTGHFVEHLTEIIHPSGDINFHGEFVFNGDADACGFGIVVFRDEGTGTGAGASSAAHAVTVDKSPNTVDVHANLEITFVGFAGTYTGSHQCH